MSGPETGQTTTCASISMSEALQSTFGAKPKSTKKEPKVPCPGENVSDDSINTATPVNVKEDFRDPRRLLPGEWRQCQDGTVGELSGSRISVIRPCQRRSTEKVMCAVNKEGSGSYTTPPANFINAKRKVQNAEFSLCVLNSQLSNLRSQF